MEDKPLMQKAIAELNHFRLPKFFLGGFWIRLAAYLIDLVIINALQSIVLNITVYRIFDLSFQSSFVVTLIELIIFVSYFYFTTAYFQGQTPGKLLFDLRVVPLNEDSSHKQVYLFRELFGKVLFYFFPYIAVLLVFSYKKQHVIDMLVDTTVIREDRLEEIGQFTPLDQ